MDLMSNADPRGWARSHLGAYRSISALLTTIERKQDIHNQNIANIKKNEMKQIKHAISKIYPRLRQDHNSNNYPYYYVPNVFRHFIKEATNEHADLKIKYYGVNNTNYYLLYRDPGEMHIAIGQERSLQGLKSIIETNSSLIINKIKRLLRAIEKLKTVFCKFQEAVQILITIIRKKGLEGKCYWETI
jgi:hypothetical protein